eukprot:tig00000981_g5879.t1
MTESAAASDRRSRLRPNMRVPNMSWVNHPDDADFALKILRLISREDILLVLHETYQDLCRKSKRGQSLSRVLFTPRTCLRDNQQTQVGEQLDEARSEQSSEMLALFQMWSDLRTSRNRLADHNAELTQRITQLEEAQAQLQAALRQQRDQADAAKDALAVRLGAAPRRARLPPTAAQVVVQENEELSKRAGESATGGEQAPRTPPRPGSSAARAQAAIARLSELVDSIRASSPLSAGPPGSASSAQTTHVLLSPSARSGAPPPPSPSCSYCSASPPPPGEPCPICVSPGRPLPGAVAGCESTPAAAPPALLLELSPAGAERTPSPGRLLRSLGYVQTVVQELAEACGALEEERDAARREAELLRARLSAAAALAAAPAAASPGKEASQARQLRELKEKLAASDRKIEELRVQIDSLNVSSDAALAAAGGQSGRGAAETRDVSMQAPSPSASPLKDAAPAGDIRAQVDALAADCREMRRSLLEVAEEAEAAAASELDLLRARVVALEAENRSLSQRLSSVHLPLFEIALSAGLVASSGPSTARSLPGSRSASPPPPLPREIEVPAPPRPSRPTSAVKQMERGPGPAGAPPESVAVPHREWPFALHRTSSMEPVSARGADKENAAAAAAAKLREKEKEGDAANKSKLLQPQAQPLQLRRSYNL